MPAKILVVDDEPDVEILINQKFIKQIHEQKYDFIFAQNGVDALRKLEKNGEIDIILTDINMPEMDGISLLAELTSRYPLVKSVIVSAYGDMENIRTAMNRGAFDFVTKPIDFADLEITINKTFQEAIALKQAIDNRDQLLTIRKELDVARKIQESILPGNFPPFPNRTDFEIGARMIPAREVGGDLYDFFLIDADRVGFVIGDVSGKGIPAALFMAISRTLLKATALKGLSAGECLQQVNRILYFESMPTMFLTVFYGILNTRTGELDYCCAGHHSPYLLHNNGRIEPLTGARGIPLSFLENYPYQTGTVTLNPGETIFMYTDGVTEAFDRDGNDFNEKRLIDCLSRMNGLPIMEKIQLVFDSVRNFSAGTRQSDDMTVLLVKYLGL